MPSSLNNDIFKKIGYNNIPQSEYQEFKYRDTSSSDIFNRNQKDILDDILDLFNKANNLEVILKESKEILEFETSHSNFKIKRLEQQIENIKLEYESNMNLNSLITKYIYPSQMTKESTTQQDEIYNCINVLPLNYETKTYIKHSLNGTTFAPTNIYNQLSFLNINKDSDIIEKVSTNFLNAVDGDNNTYWANKVTTSSNIKEIVASVEFEIPDNIITSRDVNELLLRPYPSNSIDIIDIEYKNITGGYVQIPSYQTYCTNQSDFNISYDDDREDYTILDVDSIKLNFEPIQVQKIRVTFRQKYYSNNGDGTNTFVLGFKTIDPRHNLYTNSFSKSCFVVEMPTNKKIIFDSLIPIYSNEAEIDNKKVKLDYYSLYDDGTKVKILNSTPFVCSTSKLYVEFSIKPGVCSPNILKFEAKYKFSN